jgi:hypothetical protein
MTGWRLFRGLAPKDNGTYEVLLNDAFGTVIFKEPPPSAELAPGKPSQSPIFDETSATPPNFSGPC